jgi:hypothetical protein
MGRLAPISQFSAASGTLLLFTGAHGWFSCPRAVAQESRSTIVGQILDGTGAIFPFLIPGGGSNFLDLSLLKKTRIREGHEFQFRADFFNLFKHPTEATDPNISPTSSAFGQMSQFGALPPQHPARHQVRVLSGEMNAWATERARISGDLED